MSLHNPFADAELADTVHQPNDKRVETPKSILQAADPEPELTQPVQSRPKDEMRARTVELMLEKVKKGGANFMSNQGNDFSWFNASSKILYHSLVADTPLRLAQEITSGLATNIVKRQTKTRANEKIFLLCLCKVLDFKGIPVGDITRLIASGGSMAPSTTAMYFGGVSWINHLLEGLYWGGWGHRAIDLVYLCMSNSNHRLRRAG